MTALVKGHFGSKIIIWILTVRRTTCKECKLYIESIKRKNTVIRK